jgi:N-acetyltransferase
LELKAERLSWGTVALEPMEERHREALRDAANADAEIWTIYPSSMAGEHFDGFWARLIARQAAGDAIPFAVCLEGECVGISCYLNIEREAAGLEIGGTYYRPEVRGGMVNPAAKLLLIGDAFACGARRVAFRVDAINARSRAAVLKLGAVQEGILRQSGITWTGRVRDAVVFSILRDEWPAVEAGLLERLAA